MTRLKVKDVLDRQAVQEHVDENTGMSEHVIIESPDEKKQPRIEVRDSKGKILRKYPARLVEAFEQLLGR